LRALRIAAPAQLSLRLGPPEEEPVGREVWERVPGEAQAKLLSLFARLVARSVVIEEEKR
jgi:hypothetical protein